MNFPTISEFKTCIPEKIKNQSLLSKLFIYQVMGDGKLQIDVTTEEYRHWLERQWREYKKLDSLYGNHHNILLNDIKQVEKVSADRESRILQIHHQLEENLESLTKFIKAIAL